MDKVFVAEDSIWIKASSPHPAGTEYVVSVGDEQWEEKQRVIKVQMAYGGKIAGRKSVSYPYGTDDWIRVMRAISDLIAKR